MYRRNLDQIKKTLIQEHGIKYLEIPFDTKINNIEQMIANILSSNFFEDRTISSP